MSCTAEPYQLVPSLTNVRTSTLLAPVVIVGADAPGHFTAVNVAVLLPPCVRMSVRDAPATAVGIVNVQLPLSVTRCTLADESESVVAVPLLPSADEVSTVTGSRARASVPLVTSDALWV